MERISAAENITIEMSDARWRLIANGTIDPQVVFEAESGQPVNYINEFASTRRLPRTGSLPTEFIQRVVLGWSNNDEAWHLGLLLDVELAAARGSRWCEIAHWPDPSTTVFSDIATRAGESLAQVTTRPFHLVPPKVGEPKQPTAPPLPELPVMIDETWQLEQAQNGSLQLVRAARETRVLVRRTLWYAFWSVIYFVLVSLTLTSGIAPANPAFLPYLGFFSGFVLVFLALRNIYRLRTDITRIVIDAQARQIRGQRGKQVRWLRSASEIEALYVSQVLATRGRRKRGQTHFPYGELNLLLADGAFQFLFNSEHLSALECEPEAADEDTPLDHVGELTSFGLVTGLQAAALHIGQALDRPVRYDRRVS